MASDIYLLSFLKYPPYTGPIIKIGKIIPIVNKVIYALIKNNIKRQIIKYIVEDTRTAN